MIEERMLVWVIVVKDPEIEVVVVRTEVTREMEVDIEVRVIVVGRVETCVIV